MAELLFVGNTNGTLGNLATLLGRSQPDWSIRQIASSDAALEHLERRSSDVVLACLNADPGDYEQLFERVASTTPHAIRLALFEQDANLPHRTLHAHQLFSARHNLDFLRPTLTAALEVAHRTRQPRKLAALISNLQDVPSPPTLYFDIREQLEDPNGDLSSMAQITARDPSLVARILKIANSGFYALPRSVSDLAEAIGLIGTDTLLGLVLAAHLYAGLPPPGLKLEMLWQHTLRVSTLARQITQEEGGDRHAQSQSAVAGLLHDIGLMILLENEAARYQPLWRKHAGDESALAQMERSVFGVTHGELGALILMLWSLPQEVVDAVAHSHTPTGCFAEQGIELPLTSRAVLAAEWLLDNNGESADQTPECLSDITPDTLTRWQDMRDEVADQASPF